MRVVVLTMNAPSAALVLAPLFEEAASRESKVELAGVVVSKTVTGTTPLRALRRILRESGPRFVLFGVRRKIRPVLRELLAVRLGRKLRPSQDDTVRMLVSRQDAVPYLELESIHDPGAFETVRALQPDLLVCVQFPEKLAPEQFEAPPLGTINVHPSLLPRYRGLTPLLHALADDAQEHGSTVHWIDAELDTGPILLQERFQLGQYESYPAAWLRDAQAGAEALRKALRLLSEGPVTGRPQPSEGASYCGWPSRQTLRKLTQRGIRLS